MTMEILPVSHPIRMEARTVLEKDDLVRAEAMTVQAMTETVAVEQVVQVKVNMMVPEMAYLDERLLKGMSMKFFE